ncbi:hypothetical protein CK203_025840 [Vitis vinifera]|uniref:Uncharacterized protein n=1 Tax=Vitis vinifera TaxID=29760 RepID=A0A438IGI3_VITVI|nr:hypothetical protein CK203_025840 [Vitis vinifera]
MDWHQLLKGSELRRWISGYFQWLPSNKEDHHPGVGMVLSKQLVEEDRVGLEDPFNEEEPPAALLDLDREKAWDQIDFHRSGTFERSLNATFLALVPKKGGVEDIKDCRHIRWMLEEAEVGPTFALYIPPADGDAELLFIEGGEREVPLCFKIVSRLKLIALAGRVEHMESLALGFRCKVGTIHTMDLGFKGERNSSWKSVIEREYEELEEDSYVREARKPYKVDFLTAIGKGVGRFSNLE